MNNTYASSTNLAASIILVMRRRWTLREVKLTFPHWINRSMYTCATTKQDGLQREYLKIRSTYSLMVSVGALEPWKTVITSLVCVLSSNVSFIWTDLSRCDEISDRTFGFPWFCLKVSLSPRVLYDFKPGISFSSPKDSIPKQSCIGEGKN